jgi:hypothetical protein
MLEFRNGNSDQKPSEKINFRTILSEKIDLKLELTKLEISLEWLIISKRSFLH